MGRQDDLQNFPILTRKDIVSQVQKESSQGRGGGLSTYETTGSTGTPLKIFVSDENVYYNLVRSLAQFFINNLPLDKNRVKILSIIRSEELLKSSYVQEFRRIGPAL